MTESDFEENQNVENEKAFDELRSEVLQEVALSHPICYDRYNICKLIANSKLSIFAIQMLMDICEHFDIPITDIKSKEKSILQRQADRLWKKLHLSEIIKTRFWLKTHYNSICGGNPKGLHMKKEARTWPAIVLYSKWPYSQRPSCEHWRPDSFKVFLLCTVYFCL